MTILNLTLSEVLDKERVILSDEFGMPEDYASEALDQKNALEMSKYLDCPHKEGYWKLEAKWIRAGAVNEYIFNTIKKNMPATLKKEKKESLLDVFSSRLTTKVSIILSTLVIAAQKKDERASMLNVSDYKAFQSYIDWDDFEKKFSDSLKFFKKELNNSKFSGHVAPYKLTNLGDSYIYGTMSIVETGRLKVISTNKKVLDDIGNLLISLSQVEDLNIQRVFSPEEELFDPYFEFLNSAVNWLSTDKKLQQQIKASYEQFIAEDYIHCVSTMGRIAEDYLAQVYETYLREPIPKGMTIGQLYDNLHTKIKEILKPSKLELKNLNAIYDEIKHVDLNGEDLLDADKQLKSSLREIVNLIRSDREYFNQKISESSKIDMKLSVFTKDIQNNVDELLRNRNAASHKTRLPIGRYEALKTLYCLYSMVVWWDKEKKLINWNEDKERILKDAVTRSQM